MKLLLILSFLFASLTINAAQSTLWLPLSENADVVIINDILITGNKNTRKKIILRELLFSINDTIPIKEFGELIKKSRENLINISIFNYVTIDTGSVAGFPGIINVKINVRERWYTWPVPIFEIADRNINSWWKTKDFSRTNYGLYLERNNFRGMMESIRLKVVLGYDEEWGIIYNKPYINKKQTFGISFSVGKIRNHEVAYNTYKNKLQYYKNEDNYVRDLFYSTFQITRRKNIHFSHTFQLQYINYSFTDTLSILNENYSIKNETRQQYFTLYYQFKKDFRDYKHYPLNGHYFDIEIVKNGIGILKNEDVDVLYLQSIYRKYLKLMKRFYFASVISAKISTKSFQPYFIQRGLGYHRDFVRGYEYYVVDGQNFVLSKSNFKYELISTKVKKLSFIPFRKFNTVHYAVYFNIFADIGYVKDNIFHHDNELANSWLFGTGIGLDLVTYYDKVIRIEFSSNRLGENGIFIHFMAPI